MSAETRSRVRATIVDRSGMAVDACTGADSHGDCPRAQPDGTVLCAGEVLLAVSESVDWHLALEIGHRATKCPLRGFVAPAS